MRPIIIIVSLLALIGIGKMSAQSNEKKIFIIENLFFHEVPIANTMINGMVVLTTPNGTEARGLLLGAPLPEGAKKYSIPADSIPEADELLKLFEAKKNRAITFTFVTPERIKSGDKFPDFKATDITGREWTNADVNGKVMVLNCWFTTLERCLLEMPILSKWKDEMPDVMFFSSTSEDKSIALPVIEARNFNWIPLINNTQFGSFAGKNYHPVTIVVDKSGIIRHVEYGTSPYQREILKNSIESLRKE